MHNKNLFRGSKILKFSSAFSKKQHSISIIITTLLISFKEVIAVNSQIELDSFPYAFLVPFIIKLCDSCAKSIFIHKQLSPCTFTSCRKYLMSRSEPC